MAEVLVVVEASAAAGVKKVTLEMLTIARTLGTPSAVVLGGSGAAAQFAEKLGEFGAERIYAGEGDEVDGYLVAPKATVLAELVRRVQPAAVLLASSQEGKEIAGRLAVKLDNGLLIDAVAVDADGTATQGIFAGSATVKSKVTKGLPIITIRPNSATPEAAPAAGTVEQLTVVVSDADKLTKVVERVAEKKGSRPELTEAGIVVSGGRGVASADNFKLVEELADLLGGAVGASRAAVDSAARSRSRPQSGRSQASVSPPDVLRRGNACRHDAPRRDDDAAPPPAASARACCAPGTPAPFPRPQPRREREARRALVETAPSHLL